MDRSRQADHSVLNQAMKLCVIANANSPHTTRWVTPLLNRGYQVYLVSYTTVQKPIEGMIYTDLTKITNIPVIRFIIWGIWLWKYVRKTDFALVNAQQIQAAGWLAAITGFHPIIVSAWGSDLLLEPKKSFLRKLLVRYVLLKCDRLTVPSEELRQAASRLGVPAIKITTIPWGLYTSPIQAITHQEVTEIRHKFGLNEDDQVVLSPRSIREIYNIEIVLEVLRNLAVQAPNLRLVLLRFNVDDNYYTHILEMISVYGLESRVVWLPPRESSQDMIKLYQISDVVISIPSSEGFGATVYEAMAAGCPTLITDLPVFSDLHNELHSIKVPVRDISATTDSLARLLSDNQLQDTLRENTRWVSERFSLDKQAELVDREFRELATPQIQPVEGI
jgi:glycosyltransferase involved in cell wall biosynthesis